MIPALIVPVLARPELLYRMLSSIDHPVGQLVVIDNGQVVDEQAVDAALASAPVKDRCLVKLPGNLGVAGSWNLGIKATPFASWWLIANFDVVWPAGALEAFDRLAPRGTVALVDGPQPWCAFAIGDDVVRDVGLFDEALHPAYFEDNDYERRCHAANVPILRTSIEVWHDNSSTIAAGYQERNRDTFAENDAYYRDKQAAGDYSEGRWTLDRRRRLSWD